MASKNTSSIKKSKQKVYPSQVNTKSIACRVPIAHYVKFQQEAASQGINLNDWLLAKIYTEKQQSELATSNTECAICKSQVVTEAINVHPIARQIQETVENMFELILRHNTLLIFPGEDFDQGIKFGISNENGITRDDKDPNWKQNFYLKLAKFAVRNKKD